MNGNYKKEVCSTFVIYEVVFSNHIKSKSRRFDIEKVDYSIITKIIFLPIINNIKSLQIILFM